jgi:hypothetical protein
MVQVTHNLKSWVSDKKNWTCFHNWICVSKLTKVVFETYKQKVALAVLRFHSQKVKLSNQHIFYLHLYIYNKQDFAADVVDVKLVEPITTNTLRKVQNTDQSPARSMNSVSYHQMQRG